MTQLRIAVVIVWSLLLFLTYRNYPKELWEVFVTVGLMVGVTLLMVATILAIVPGDSK